MADGLHGQRAAHQHADVERLRDLLIRGSQVEDLLDSVVDSVEAVLGNGDCQRRQATRFHMRIQREQIRDRDLNLS